MKTLREQMKTGEDIPPMTTSEQWAARVALAMSHEDGGKCMIYGDDGELQCSNYMRHGRTIDFRREKFQDLIDIVSATRMIEANKHTSDPYITPVQLVEAFKKAIS